MPKQPDSAPEFVRFIGPVIAALGKLGGSGRPDEVRDAIAKVLLLFQCKRYTGSVTPSQVRDFRGAMMGSADKGIIITIGSFTSDARKEAVRDGVPPIGLVDGEKLVNMLEQPELGLTPQRTFEVDSTFFDQFGR